MPFDPQKHLSKLRGNDYLEVKWRLVWFREVNPKGRIVTDLISHDLEKKWALVKATIYDNDGNELSSGYKTEDMKGFGDYIEKAETGAIGRALAAAGYGTQFAPDYEAPPESGRLADSPVTPPKQEAKQTKTAAKQEPAKQEPAKQEPKTKPTAEEHRQNLESLKEKRPKINSAIQQWLENFYKIKNQDERHVLYARFAGIDAFDAPNGKEINVLDDLQAAALFNLLHANDQDKQIIPEKVVNAVLWITSILPGACQSLITKYNIDTKNNLSESKIADPVEYPVEPPYNEGTVFDGDDIGEIMKRSLNDRGEYECSNCQAVVKQTLAAATIAEVKKVLCVKCFQAAGDKV